MMIILFTFGLSSCLETQTTVQDNTQAAKKFDVDSQNNYILFEGLTLNIIDINIDKTSSEISENVTYSCFYDQSLNGVVTGSNACSTLTGFNFSSSDGTIDWTPGFDIVSSDEFFEIKVIASDGIFSDSEIFNIKLVNKNRAPELAFLEPKYIDELATLNLDFNELNTATDIDLDGDTVFYTCEYKSQEAQYSNLTTGQISTIQALRSLVDSATTQEDYDTFYSNLISYISNFTVVIPEVWLDCTNIFQDPIKGMNFNASSGALSWTPNKNEQHKDRVYKIRITATDGEDSSSQIYSMNVIHQNTPVEIKDFSDMNTYTVNGEYYTYEGVAIEDLRFSSSINLSVAAGASASYSCFFDTTIDNSVSSVLPCSMIGITFDLDMDRFEYDGSVNSPADAYEIKLIRSSEEVIFQISELEAIEYIDEDGEPLTFRCVYDTLIDGSVSSTNNCNEVGFNINSNTGRASFTPSQVNGDVEYEFMVSVDDNNQSTSSTLFGVHVKDKSKVHFDEVTFGEDHTCALSKVGEIYCWGDNDLGQLGVGDNINRKSPLKISFDSENSIRFRKIKSQLNHTCALTFQGELYCWGENTNGQLGVNNTNNSNVPLKMEMATSVLPKEIVDFSVGAKHTCVVNSLGRVYCVGDNSYGQLGLGAVANRTKLGSSPTSFNLYPFRNIYRIESGDFHTCALAGSGAFFCWGRNDQGQIGDGSNTDYDLVYKVTFNTYDFSLGANHTCYIDENLQPQCFGDNANGQLGIGNTTDQNTPTATGAGTFPAVKIRAGREHTCIIPEQTSDEVVCFGIGDNGQLGDGSSTSDDSGVQAIGTEGLFDLFVGENSSCVNQNTGLLCWGDNENYQFLDGTTSDYDSPQVVSLDSLGYYDEAIYKVSLGSRACYTKVSGEAYCTGLGFDINTAFDTSYRLFPPINHSYFEEIFDYLTPGSSSGVASYVTRDNQFHSYGGNSESFWSAAGTGFTSFFTTPIVSNSFRGDSIAQSSEHVCYLGDSSQNVCSGENSNDEHGNVATPMTNTYNNNLGGPVSKKVVVGKDHSCFLDVVGKIHCTGVGRAVGLDGIAAVTPTEIDTSDYVNLRFIDVFAGDDMTCGISDRHELYCFGEMYPDEPVAKLSTPSSTYYRDVSISEGHACAISTHGETYCWGDNSSGQLGDGSLVDRSVPFKISNGSSSLNKFKDISVNGNTSCGVTVGGELYCWGENSVLMNFNNLTSGSIYSIPMLYSED